MRNNVTWVEVECRVADAIRQTPWVGVTAGRSDLDGQWGPPSVYTEWGIRDGDQVLLREWRFPSIEKGAPDRSPCVHRVPTRQSADQ